MPTPVAPNTLTAAGLSPDRADRATFVARSIQRDDFIKNTQIPELQASITNVYNNSLEAYNSGVSAAANAASSAINASQAATAATAIQWVSGTSYAIGDARWSPITKISYRRLIAGAGTTDPSADATNWAAIVTPVTAGGTGGTTQATARSGIGAAASGVNTDITDLTALTIPRLGNRYLHARDEKATGTNAGTSTAGDNTRTLNTMVANTITGASLATNQITLPAGSYRIHANSPCFAGDGHVLRVYNVTDSVDLLIGQVAHALSGGAGIMTAAHVIGHFTLAATKVISLRHKIITGIVNGLGVNAGAAIEVYAQIIITKE